MRFRFSGLIQETRRPIEGNVTASTADAARSLLAENGVLAQKIWSLEEPADEGGAGAAARPAGGGAPAGRGSFAPRGGAGGATPPPPQAPPVPAPPVAAATSVSGTRPVPKPPVAGAGSMAGPGMPADEPPMVPGSPGDPNDPFSSAIDSAFDASATNVSVDRLMARYRGQQVRVIDRDKIRRQVQEVVGEAIRSASDAAVAHTQAAAGSQQAADVAAQQQSETLEKVAQALDKVFGDQKNLTSEAPSSTAMVAIEDQIARLTRVVLRVESAVNRLMLAGAASGMGGGGAAPVRGQESAVPPRDTSPAQNKVLMEIFETNRELRGLAAASVDGDAPTPNPEETAGGGSGGAAVAVEAQALSEMASEEAKPSSRGAKKKTKKKTTTRRSTKKKASSKSGAAERPESPAGAETDNPPAKKKAKRRSTKRGHNRGSAEPE